MDIPQSSSDNNNGDNDNHDACDIAKTVTFMEGDDGRSGGTADSNNSNEEAQQVQHNELIMMTTTTATTTPTPSKPSTDPTATPRFKKRTQSALNGSSSSMDTHKSTPYPSKKFRTLSSLSAGERNNYDTDENFVQSLLNGSRLSLESQMEAELGMNSPQGRNPNEEGLQQPQDDAFVKEQLPANSGSVATSGTTENHQGHNQQQRRQEAETARTEEEPDWNKLTESEPAKTDVPIFLSATEKRMRAEERFGTALDECHASLTASVDALMNTAADIYSTYGAKIDALENEIKQDLEGNHRARVAMKQRLEAYATETQAMFAQLLMRVVSASGGTNSAASASVAARIQSKGTRALTNGTGASFNDRPSNP
mmetsp:Transcript_19174/g.27088  ORF Transcript_19174/g.27088 Transcript_19174/m.27088 type:complete len:369 (-) Transcript_19174:238-1344(-)